MVNPIKNEPPGFRENRPKKKVTKEVDLRVKKAVKKSSASFPAKENSPVIASLKIAAKKEALKAQKAAFLAQRAHMAQQSAAAKRAQIAEAAKKEAQKAAKKAADLRLVFKIKAYLDRLFKKQPPSSPKKKKKSD